MFSPLSSSQVEEWLAHLNAPLKRLPAHERAELHLEVRQHLDALVAANEELGSSPEEAWELALTQFGDPAQIGRKMYQEWRQGRIGFRATVKAIAFGLVLQVITGWLCSEHIALIGVQHGNSIGYMETVGILDSVVASFAVSVAIGRRYPYQAVKGALYSGLCAALLLWMPVVLSAFHAFSHIVFSQPFPLFAVTQAAWLLFSVGIAYLASVTKRGWYKPSLADFTLTLPRKRRRRLPSRG